MLTQYFSLMRISNYHGGLPVLEARGLLDENVPIIATPPTIDLVKLLEDSLKIYQLKTMGRDRQFTE